MSIDPLRKNFIIWRGATFRKVFTYYTGPPETSPAKNLAGWTATMPIRSNSTVVRTLTSGDGSILLGGLTGKITLLLTDEETAEITWNSAQYELFLTDVDGNTDIYLFGGLSVRGT